MCTKHSKIMPLHYTNVRTPHYTNVMTPHYKQMTQHHTTHNDSTFTHMCLAGAVANVADSDRCRCNPKVPSSIPAGGKDFP